MVIRKGQYPVQDHPGFKGGEGSFRTQDIAGAYLGRAGRMFSLGTLKSGASVGLHTHAGDMEICYFLSGEGTVTEGDTHIPVSAGDANIVLPGESHSIANTGGEDLVYLLAVLYPQ